MDYCDNRTSLIFITKNIDGVESQQTLYKIFVPILLVGCVFSILLNTILVAVGTLSRSAIRSRSPILVLSLNLAATDGMASFFMGIGLVLNSYLPVVFDVKIVSTYCLVVVLEILRLSSLIASASHLLALALVHYKGIVNPLHYRSVIFCSQHRTRSIYLMTIICWLVPAVTFGAYFTSIPCQGFQTDNCQAEFVQTFRFRIIVVIAFFIPLLLMFVLYTRIFVIIKQHQAQRAVQRQQSTQISNRIMRTTAAYLTTEPVAHSRLHHQNSSSSSTAVAAAAATVVRTKLLQSSHSYSANNNDEHNSNSSSSSKSNCNEHVSEPSVSYNNHSTMQQKTKQICGQSTEGGGSNDAMLPPFMSSSPPPSSSRSSPPTPSSHKRIHRKRHHHHQQQQCFNDVLVKTKQNEPKETQTMLYQSNNRCSDHHHHHSCFESEKDKRSKNKRLHCLLKLCTDCCEYRLGGVNRRKRNSLCCNAAGAGAGATTNFLSGCDESKSTTGIKHELIELNSSIRDRSTINHKQNSSDEQQAVEVCNKNNNNDHHPHHSRRSSGLLSSQQYQSTATTTTGISLQRTHRDGEFNSGNVSYDQQSLTNNNGGSTSGGGGGGGGGNGSSGGGHAKALVTTLLILGTYILCWMPAVIFFALTCVDYCPYPLNYMNYRLRIILGFITNGLVILKAIVDPFIYTYRMKEMKIALNRCFTSTCPTFMMTFCPRYLTDSQQLQHSQQQSISSFSYRGVSQNSANNQVSCSVPRGCLVKLLGCSTTTTTSTAVSCNATKDYQNQNLENEVSSSIDNENLVPFSKSATQKDKNTSREQCLSNNVLISVNTSHQSSTNIEYELQHLSSS